MANIKLTKKQKESIGLLLIGTFLEYFDLMLYIHMSVLLNELFFPTTDPLSTKLLVATTFCLTYCLRPIGGFIIGRIGDTMGRKFTIIISTFIMACSCILIAITPTYNEIGIIATVIMIICRMLQGVSSMGEIVGVQLYIAEMLKAPYKSVISGLIGVSEIIGGLFALLIASIILSINGNWRWIFVIGAGIAVFGFLSRTKLKETREFMDHKLRTKDYGLPTDKKKFDNEKDSKLTILAYFFTEFHFPVCFYTAYVVLGDFFSRKIFQLTSEKVISQNLRVTIFLALFMLVLSLLAKKIHPIKTAILAALSFIFLLPFIPYWIDNTTSLFGLFCLQCLIMSFGLSTWGILDSIQYKYISIANRFTTISIIVGVAQPISYIMVSFGSIPLIDYFGYYGLWALFIPVVIGYFWGVHYFKNLEIKRGSYYNYPNEDFPHDDTAIKEDDYEYNLGDDYVPFKGSCEYRLELLDKIKMISKQEDKKLNIKLIEKAIVFAKKWHGIKMRKTGDHPFYFHPLAVAAMVAEYYCKTDVIVASILHDVVEDSDCDIELIKKEFNTRIAQIVDRLTKKRIEDGKNIILSFEQIIKKLQALNDYEALFIKKMDRKHNLETIEGLSPEKQKKMAEETNNIFMRLISIIGDKLGIHGKLRLENNIFQLCYRTLKRK